MIWKWMHTLFDKHYIIVEGYYGSKIRSVTEGAKGVYISQADGKPFRLDKPAGVTWWPVTFTMDEFEAGTVFDLTSDKGVEEHY